MEPRAKPMRKIYEPPPTDGNGTGFKFELRKKPSE
jgi:hypothetical protein